MLVSLIIPVWNKPDYLEATLKCLSNQTVKASEIIIVDDMSDLEMASRHKQLASIYGSIYHYNDHPPKAMRRTECNSIGADLASGDILGFLCVDHIYNKDYLERCIDVVGAYKNLVLFHAVFCLPDLPAVKAGLAGGKTLDDMIGFRHAPYYGGYTGKEQWWSTLNDIHPTEFITGCDGNVFLRASHIRQLGLWDANLVGHGDHCFDFARSCLINDLACIVMRDIVSYNMTHDRPAMLMDGSEEHLAYLNEKWSGVRFSPVAPVRTGQSTKLNIGCNRFPLPDYINIDIEPKYTTDATNCDIYDVRQMDALELKFPDASFDEVYASHILEHIHINYAERALDEWVRVLKPGGTILICVPDLRLMAEHYTANDIDWFKRNKRDDATYRDGTIGWKFAILLLNFSEHRMFYDYETLEWLLAKRGIENIHRCTSFVKDSSYHPYSLNVKGTRRYADTD